MKIGIAWAKALLPVGFMLVAVATARAQYAPSPYAMPGQGPAQPAFYGQPAEAPPAYYNQPGMDPQAYYGQPGMEGMPEYSEDPGMGYEMDGGYVPTDDFGIPYLGADRAFGTGGIAHPRWFDVSADLILFTRDNAGRAIPYSSAGGAGPTVLSTNDLKFPSAAGFRFTANYLIGAGRNLELGYFGTLNFSSNATVAGVGSNLFSPFSNFGANPTFIESDNADRHSIAYSTNLNSTELNVRQRWTSPNGRVHSSLLSGVRYLKIDEDFIYRTEAGANNLVYATKTNNDLVGFQVGGDIMTAVIPRLKFGLEAKAGVFGNIAQLRNNINSTAGGLPDAAIENFHKNNCSFVGEAGGFTIIHITPKWNLRAGYQVVAVTGLALATENFNSNPAFGTRAVAMNIGGQAMYHGGQVGLEYMW